MSRLRVERAHTLLVQADDLRRAALQLLAEDDREQRDEAKVRAAALACRCGHRHDDHTGAYSPNYSAGVCRRCPCMHFLVA